MTNNDMGVVNNHEPTWRIFLVCVGLSAISVNMIVGGALASQMPMSEWLTAIVVGGVIIASIAGYTAWHSSRTGLPFAVQAREIFGPVGSKVIAAFVACVILGWYSIQASLVANAAYMWVDSALIPVEVYFLAVPMIMASTALLGFKGLFIGSVIGVPTMAALIIFAWSQIEPVSGSSGTVVEPGMSVWTALNIVMALWIMGAVATVGDVTRFAKPSLTVVGISFSAFIIGNTGLMLAGAWAVQQTNASDLSQVLSAVGMAGLGFLLLLANTWTTNDNAIYSVSLNIRHVSGRFTAKQVILAASVLAGLIGLTRPYESGVLIEWLNTLGIMVPAVGGAIIGHRLSGASTSVTATWFALATGVAVAASGIFDFSSLASLLSTIAVLLCANLVLIKVVQPDTGGRADE